MSNANMWDRQFISRFVGVASLTDKALSMKLRASSCESIRGEENHFDDRQESGRIRRAFADLADTDQLYSTVRTTPYLSSRSVP